LWMLRHRQGTYRIAKSLREIKNSLSNKRFSPSMNENL